MIMANLLSTEINYAVVNIQCHVLASVYRVDTPTCTVHYYCILHTHYYMYIQQYYKHNVPDGPFSHTGHMCHIHSLHTCSSHKAKKKKHLIIVLDKVTKFLIFYSSLILTEIRGWGWAPSQPYVCGLAHNYYGSDAGISAPRL